MASHNPATKPITLEELRKKGDRAMAAAAEAMEILRTTVRESQKLRQQIDEDR